MRRLFRSRVPKRGKIVAMAAAVGLLAVGFPPLLPVSSDDVRDVAADSCVTEARPAAARTARPPAAQGLSAVNAAYVPPLDPGMANVTKPPEQAYQFQPAEENSAEQVSVPYDPAAVGKDFDTQDVHTYQYDDTNSCWRQLERLQVDEENQTIVSVTSQAGVLVNAAVTVPDSPQGTSFNPTQIKNIQAAQPGSGINLMGTPAPNNSGEAQLSYPIHAPPGRGGLQPQLGLQYNSSVENGWLGVGWEMQLPSITVDTRFGVPRYDAATETETYLFGGQQLAPIAHRTTPGPRSAEKVFFPRIENGAFDKIIRHGDKPANYSWETIDKHGTRSFYGGTPESTLTDGTGNIFRWALRETRTVDDDFIRYHSVRQEDFGVPEGGAIPGSDLYLKRITYTGHGATEGPYAVTLTRDRELGEPRRPDATIDARGGFKKVTADLLRKVEVTFGDQLIRRYELNYQAGAFGKTLLKAVSQFGDNGAPFHTHDFAYHDDIRDGQGNYQAFARTDWTSPGDNLGTAAGPASALNSSSSTGAGGHLYVGFGPNRTKSGSIGAKTGFAASRDEGLLALADMDGDTLPDKVIRTGNGVAYRKNLAKPGGQAKFSDELKPLNLPGIANENSDTVTVGIESYIGGVAAQLDHVDTFTTNDRYFTDVNADGLTDLVSKGNVLFGRVGSDGNPVFGRSNETPVPIGDSKVDTNGLLPDFAADRQRREETYPLLDSVRRWVAPFDGTVQVTGNVKLLPPPQSDGSLTDKGDLDGVRVAIQHEDTERWSRTINAGDHSEHIPSNVDRFTVQRGQKLYFRVGSRHDGTNDQVAWDPTITYTGIDGTDINGLSQATYQASRDFTLGGRTATLQAPVTGTVKLGGVFTKKAATTDDVTVQVLRDGQPAFERTMASTETGEVRIDQDIPITKDQQLEWRLKIDSPVDLDQVAWVPTVTYTADGVTTNPPVTIDMYPSALLDRPQGLFTAPRTGDLTVEPRLQIAGSGQVTFTVKKRGALLGKKVIEVTNGTYEPQRLTVPATEGDVLSFDFSTRDTGMQVESWGATADAAEVPVGFHRTAAEETFPQPYRGWGVVGYAANGERATRAIPQADLVINQDYRGQLPTSLDPVKDRERFEADPKVITPKVVQFTPEPKENRWSASGSSFVARQTVSSSRYGGESVDLPKSSDFEDLNAPARVSRSKQTSLTGSIGGDVGTAGGSVSFGDSSAEVDYLDMNGDGFPDVVAGGRVQFSDETGVLTANRGTLPGSNKVRESSNVSGNASAGSAARTITTGRGHATPPANSTANSAQSGNDMPPLGVGGSLGTGKSTEKFDLLDINGDSLPDRVTADGRVTLNLGWKFADQSEPWPGGGLHDGTMSNEGVNIGFNTDFYGLAGGASLNHGRASAKASLVDVNGDGLLDRVFDGDPIRVAMNTGSGFTQAQPFNGSLAGINLDQNSKLAAGAYFRFSLCFGVFGCVITNPGGHTDTGTSRTERMLRDIDGDGYADHLQSTKDNELVFAQNKTGRTNLLKSVHRPMGGRIDLDYARDGNTYDLPQSRWVLSKVTMNDGLPGDGNDTQVTTFRYEGGLYDRFEREFHGYRKIVEEHRDPEAVYRSITREFHDGYYLRGQVKREITTDAAGKPFTEILYTYKPRDILAATVDLTKRNASIWSQPIRTDKRFYEGRAAPVKQTYSEVTYDDIGNVTRQFEPGEPGPADDVETITRYTTDFPECQDKRILDVPHTVDVLGNRKVMRHRESDVDCRMGRQTQHRALLENGDVAVTDMTYDDFGNLTSVTGPPNKFSQRYRVGYTYDPVVNTHLEAVTDSFGLRSSSTTNLKFGQAETTTDHNNQQLRHVFDPFGRIDSVTGPYEIADNKVTIDFEYHPEAPVAYAVTRHIDRDAGGIRADTIDTIQFVDGLNRVVQTKKDAALHVSPSAAPANGMTVSGRMKYDFLGRTTEMHYPTSEPKGPDNVKFAPAFDSVTPTRTSFDILDRVTKTVMPDNTETTVSFGFATDRLGLTQFETVSKDANGIESRTYRNIRDEVTTVKESNPKGNQPAIFTSYAYDPLGQLLRVVDDRNNITQSSYDNFGRKTVVDNPDTGRTETQYDLADNPVKLITANLGAITRSVDYDYDFNRLTAVRYPMFPANNITYTYGPPGAPHHAAGRVTRVTDGAGTADRAYGPLGELAKETRTVLGKAYTTQYRHDSWNRVLQMTFPDGELLTYRYNSGGLVDQATGSKHGISYPYLKRLDYDRFEQRALQDTGNGGRTVYTYDTTDRRLQTLESKVANGDVLQKLNYDYDHLGNVTSLRNDRPKPGKHGPEVGGPTVQTFGYDDLSRLTSATGEYRGRDDKVNRYQLTMAYDTVNNITLKDQKNTLNNHTVGKTTYKNPYVYNSGHPHAPSTVGTQQIRYDANGNLTYKEEGHDRTQQIWDDENRLACTHEGKSLAIPREQASCDRNADPAVRFTYDDQGNRVVKDAQGDINLYPSPGFTERDSTKFKHIFVGQERLATKVVRSSGKETQQYYFHPDHIGSQGYVTDGEGDVTDHNEYFPSGESWVNERSSQAGQYKFAGKELDSETGLYYFGARYYDPRSGVWQSTDPADRFTPDDGTIGLNPYQYAAHNPLRLVDPDGRLEYDASTRQFKTQPGDTLWAIARETGVPLDTLVAMNIYDAGLSEVDTMISMGGIGVGQEIFLPDQPNIDTFKWTVANLGMQAYNQDRALGDFAKDTYKCNLFVSNVWQSQIKIGKFSVLGFRFGAERIPTANETADPDLDIKGTQVVPLKDAILGDVIAFSRDGNSGHTAIYTGFVDITNQPWVNSGGQTRIRPTVEREKNHYGSIGTGAGNPGAPQIMYRNQDYLERHGDFDSGPVIRRVIPTQPQQ
ncbi:SpvB/TcaC N-terminal domain-containing protein [Kibdelosporangium aridum]|uniref:RHS repeat-associated core domain-containing protein n=1 Tax=Kibdelosporangium aridum TaxID=2030 RepID=A0A1Y5Y601_KIBAR|nr:SpvB/TcaC N-terminal domain-containing protein [Kibdelosporangium aridum]SMD26223.1 RHS repeat-associated core domain-containing protein [Kibdelosporangium aridum]